MTEPAPRGSLTPEYLLDRRRRWLLEHFRSDRDLYLGQGLPAQVVPAGKLDVYTKPTCRCWCCGKLLGKAALFVSLTDPTKGTRTNNLRPACRDHATEPAAPRKVETVDLVGALRASVEAASARRHAARG